MAQMNCANLYLFGEDIEAVFHDPEADSACIKAAVENSSIEIKFKVAESDIMSRKCCRPLEPLMKLYVTEGF